MKRFVVDPKERTWLPTAPLDPFSIQNIPLARGWADGEPRAFTRIGNSILDLTRLAEQGLVFFVDGLDQGQLDPNPEALSRLRQSIFELVREDCSTLRDDELLKKAAIRRPSDVTLGLPFSSRGYVDFYSGIHHASNVGKMFRPDMPPLLPNYRWLPVAYNGRASSLVPSGTAIRRPAGQLKSGDAPHFAPTEELDFELELGFYVGKGTKLGTAVGTEQAEDHIAGFVIVNDWSARDVQRWEYQPLGPFLAKSFATSVSPWLVLIDALEPFRSAGMPQDPAPLDYLKCEHPGHFDINLSVSLKSAGMGEAQVISRTNSLELYWNASQQLAHQTCNGTPIEPGDLYASGTISSEKAHPDGLGAFGSLLELSYRGKQPISMTGTDEVRAFLADGDEVTLAGWCEKDGVRVGLGEVSGKVLPSD